MSDRLSFETVQEPVVPEQNRLFVIIAIGLVGMLVLGLLGVGGYVVFARTKHASAVVSPPTSVAFVSAATPTVMATNTPAPTLAPAPVKLTNTPVVLAPTATSLSLGGVVNPTATPQLLIRTTVVVATSAAPGAQTLVGGVLPTDAPQGQEAPPNTGFGLGFAGLGAGLAGLAFVARRLRLS